MKGQLMTVVVAAVLAAPNTSHADPVSHVRYVNARIAEAFDELIERSQTFRGLVAELNASDVVVYVDDGRCAAARSCLHFVSAPAGTRYLRVLINPRQPIAIVAGELAHELRHAVEIADRAEVREVASMRTLYQEIGYSSCEPRDCWETDAARFIEATVLNEHRGFRTSASRNNR